MSEVFISGRGLVSAAGWGLDENINALGRGEPALRFDESLQSYVGVVPPPAEAALVRLRAEKPHKRADRAVLLGVLAAREAYKEYGAKTGAEMEPRSAVIMGSSRGATGVLEREHQAFLESGKVAAHTSPTSTAGAFAAAVAQDLKLTGMSVSVSSACSTSLNALGMGYALVKAGVAREVIVGGAEAPLTAFTVAQLRTVGVLVRPGIGASFPSKPYHEQRTGMVPGEGAACLVMSGRRPIQGAAIRVAGFAAGTEGATPTGISDEGIALRKAITQALAAAELEAKDIGMVIGHGASTVKGDAAELSCYRQIFGATAMPPLISHKWLTGHMIGAAGAYSIALACAHLERRDVPPMPHLGLSGYCLLPSASCVLVTALGFGGNAAAAVLSLA